MSTVINKPNPTKNFTTFHNEMLQDERLSFQALGIVVMMLSRPMNWETCVKWLYQHRRNGKQDVQRALKELEQFGYLRREKQRDSKGRVSTMHWIWDGCPAEAKASAGKTSAGDPPTTKDRSEKEQRLKEKKKGAFVPKDTSVFKPRYPYPQTEQELQSLLTKYGVSYNPDHDGNLFNEMTQTEWKTPDGKPVYDVVKFYEARLKNNLPTSRPIYERSWSPPKSKLPRFVL